MHGLREREQHSDRFAPALMICRQHTGYTTGSLLVDATLGVAL